MIIKLLVFARLSLPLSRSCNSNAAESSGTMEGNLTFRPLVPELSINLHIVTEKYQT